MIRKTKKLERYIGKKISETAINNIGQTHPDLLGRAAAFLLLKDSKASYTIEGETPPHSRIERWGRIIGEAGQRKLSIPELEYLQGNVEVLNETIDLYRYFDATKQAEFFFECVEETVNKTLLDEVEYLKKYDFLNEFIKNYIDMPDHLVDLLIRFLSQNNGKLSKRRQKKEFAKLTDHEIQAIEQKYEEIFD